MENENLNENEDRIDAKTYLENLDALRNTTVSKEDYDRVVADNKRLATALANGDFSSGESDETANLDLESCRAKMFDGRRKTDMELFQDMMNLRNAAINAGERDPFLHNDPAHIPTMQEEQDAERIAREIQASLDYADGDPEVFRQEMLRKGGGKG